MDEASYSYAAETTTENITMKLSESLYQLYKPRGKARAQVIFFHEFQLGEDYEQHLSTWRSGEGSSIWPQTWLVDEFPDAHVFTVTYRAELVGDSKAGKVDIYIVVENIISDLLKSKIGQDPRCPIILVGHSFGGLIMKELCMHAHNIDTLEHDNFLSAVKGLFFYSAPHGIPNMEVIPPFLSDNPSMEYVETISISAARMNAEFDRLVNKYGWHISGVGENLPIKLDPLTALVVVPGTSTDGGVNLMPNAHHITACKPMRKSSTSLTELENLLYNLFVICMQVVRPENFQHLPRKVFGMENTLDKLKIKLLEATSLGLEGMGGIGKSTLAKALFNVLEAGYEYTCFVRDVKMVTKSKDIMDAIVLNMHHWGQGMGKEKKNSLWFLKGKRLLLILDDVASEDKDLEIVTMLQNTICTHKDSRFVVTSRDGELLKRCLNDVHTLDHLMLYPSKQLFLFHAFPEGVPPLFGGDIDDIVAKCGQLPLALEVTGKHLKHKGESIWREAGIALSRRRTIHGLQEQLMSTLRLSYDGLDEEEKQMFLDAAIVFYGGTLDTAKSVWSLTTKESQATRWQHLVDLSLVWELRKEDTRHPVDVSLLLELMKKDTILIGMHEQLRSLAIQIASTPGGDGRRIWDNGETAWGVFLGTGSSSDDVQDIVALNLNSELLSQDIREGMLALQRGKMGCCQFLEGLKERQWCGGVTESEVMERVCIPRSILLRMRKLRYLQLDNVDVDDTHVNKLPSTLIWLVWLKARFINLPFNPVAHKRMTVLVLSSDKLCTLPSNFGRLSGLQVLEITSKLKSLPDSFGELLCLRELTFHNSEFVILPETFGSLKSLKELRLHGARKLKALPQSVGGLSQLRLLELNGCHELETLPESFGRLGNLEQLTFQGAGKLKTLPQSFGNLSQLKVLELDGCCELEAFPDSFGRMQNLKELKFEGARKLNALSKSFGDLSQLELLELRDCGELEALPDSFGRLRNLKQLQIRGAEKLKALPESFGDLSQLEVLVLFGCRELDVLPNSFGQLQNLKQLLVYFAEQLKALPQSLGNLSQLKVLILHGCLELEALPTSLGRLRNLKLLKCERAGKLRILPQSIGDLLELDSLTFNQCSELEALPDSLGRLRKLKKLRLLDTGKLKELPQSLGDLSQLDSLQLGWGCALEALPESFGRLRNLKDLMIMGAGKLKALPQSFGDLSQLRSLGFVDCSELEALPNSFGRLRNLRNLSISGIVKSLPQSFGGLSELNSLIIEHCPMETFPDSFGGLSKLRKLNISSLLKLKRLPDTFGDLAMLEELTIVSCEALSTLPDSCGGLAMLKKLYLRECNSLSALPHSFDRLPMLKEVDIKDCATLKKLPETLQHYIG